MKSPEGILENNLFLIEEGSSLRAEVASIMNHRIRWTFKDFRGLVEVG